MTYAQKIQVGNALVSGKIALQKVIEYDIKENNYAHLALMWEWHSEVTKALAVITTIQTTN